MEPFDFHWLSRICTGRDERDRLSALLALYHVDFHGLNFDPELLQPLDRGFDIWPSTLQLERDDSNFVRDAGLANVGDHRKFLG